MNAEQWKEVFVNAGSFILGLIFACGQLYTVIKLKKQEKRNNEKETAPKHYGKAIKEENQYAMQIQTELEELRQALNADRAQVLEFHNGTNFSTRKGYKLDCTYETLKYGNESVKGILKDYPTTMLPVFMNKIIDDKQYFVQDVRTISKCDMSTYAMKLNMHVAAFYDVALEDNGMPVGVLAVQYVEPKELTEDDIAMLHAKKIIIEELLK